MGLKQNVKKLDKVRITRIVDPAEKQALTYVGYVQHDLSFPGLALLTVYVPLLKLTMGFQEILINVNDWEVEKIDGE